MNTGLGNLPKCVKNAFLQSSCAYNVYTVAPRLFICAGLVESETVSKAYFSSSDHKSAMRSSIADQNVVRVAVQ